MIFDKTTIAPCIIQPPKPPDPRCQDSAFALQHPDLCSNSALILKPGIASLCFLDSVMFSLFEFFGGFEMELTTGVSFTSSDPTVFAIGVNSGSGTAIGSGDVIITATYGDRSVQATINVQAEDHCCDEVTVQTAIVVDNSLSMGRTFGGDYSTRLVFAKAVASSYGGLIAEVAGLPKDSVEVWSVNSTLTQLLASSQDTAAILAAIAGITQTQQKTGLLAVFTTAAQGLLISGATTPVLLLISDCEVTVGDRQPILDAAFAFKAAGGIVVVVAPRASGVLQGFDLAERIATPGFFINANAANASNTLTQLNYIKKLLCAGSCVDAGDRYENQPALAYSFSPSSNWEVVDGIVNLLGPGLMDFLPGNGLYVELAGQAHAVIGTIDSFNLVAGQKYLIHFKAAGNQQSQSAAQSVSVSMRIGPTSTFATNTKIFEQTVFPAWNAAFGDYNFTFTALYDATVHLYFEQNYAGTDIPGSLLDDVLFKNETDSSVLLADNFDAENLVYILPACGPNAALGAIADPGAPVITVAVDQGTGLAETEVYTYSISAVTNEGETAATLCSLDPFGPLAEFDGTILKVEWPADTTGRVVEWHLWRSLGIGTFDWIGEGEPRYLLATLPANQTVYFDSEHKAEFTARYEPSVQAPTENTTAVSAGGLGYGYGQCCYHTYDVYLGPDLPEIPDPGYFYLTRDDLAAAGNKDFYIFSFSTGDGQSRTTLSTLADAMTPTTNVDPTQILPFDEDLTAFIAPQLADPRVTHVNVWRLKTCAAAAPSDSPLEDFRFLASVPKSALTLTDNLTCAEWFAEAPETTPPTENTTGGPGDPILTDVYTNICPPCSDEIGAQTPDSQALPDIELNSPPIPETFTAEKCVSCLTGFINISTVNLIPLMTSNTAPSGEASASSSYTTYLPWKAFDRGTAAVGWISNGALPQWLQYRAAAANTAAIYAVTSYKAYGPKAWTLQGSNNGSAWTTLDSRSNQTWGFDQRKLFQIATPAAYSYYRITVSETTSPPDLGIGGAIQELEMFAAAPVSVCATATSTMNQGDADTKATDAARLLLNCVPVFSDTVSAQTTPCPLGQYGGTPISASATATSYNSQPEAHDLATAAAQALADANRDCSQSNNDQKITIADNAVAVSYPSVKYVSGLAGVISKVTVTLFGLSHASPDDIEILLVSPAGSKVKLWQNCGGSTAISNAAIILDDDAASALPDDTAIVAGTYRPANYSPGTALQMLPPAPALPYEQTLAAFIGENPNGSWALWIFDDLATSVGQLAGGWDLTIS